MKFKPSLLKDNIHSIAYGALPVYSVQIDLPSEYWGYELQFEIAESDTLSFTESSGLTDADLLKDKPLWQIEYDQLTAKIYVVPMIAGQNEMDIQLITDFKIILNLIPVEPGKKQLNRETSFKDNSVLSEGNWYKIGIVQTGIHKITYSDLQALGITPESLDIDEIGIFGNYKGMLPEYNAIERTDDLSENAIKIMGDSDGEFNQGDYIVFNAISPVIWEYNIFSSRFHHENNFYTDTTYYFLTTNQGNGMRIENIPSSAQQPTFTITSFSDFDVHDKDLENLIYSGKEWFGESFSGDTLERTFSFSFPNKVHETPVYLSFEIIGRAFTNSYYQVYANEMLVIDSILISKVSSNGGIYARRSTKSVTFFTEEDQIDIKVKYINR